MDWRSIFMPETPFLEIILRGSIMYLSLFVLLRAILKRQSGDVGLSDLLVVVLIADAAQNGMADDYRSLPDGILLVFTIIFWSYAIDWLGFRFPPIQRFLIPPPLALIKEGKLLHRNLRRELITEAELLTKLRREGLKDISEVKEAFMEGDGGISFVPYER